MVTHLKLRSEDLQVEYAVLAAHLKPEVHTDPYVQDAIVVRMIRIRAALKAAEREAQP